MQQMILAQQYFRCGDRVQLFQVSWHFQVFSYTQKEKETAFIYSFVYFEMKIDRVFFFRIEWHRFFSNTISLSRERDSMAENRVYQHESWCSR